MIKIEGQARLGKTPELKYVGDDGKKPVCELRVKFLSYKGNKESEDDPIDNGFWADVNLWTNAEEAAKLFNKGDRVIIKGRLSENTWPDKDNDEKQHQTMHVDANYIAPHIADINSLVYNARPQQNTGVNE